MRTVIATRYVTPLREGGSLPGLVEADDDGLYVVKFRGAGQGPRALVAEWLAGEVARAIGLPVPDLVGVEVDPGARRRGARRGDPRPRAGQRRSESRDGFPARGARVQPGRRDRPDVVDPDFAADLVWLDAFVTNPDRTAQNPNLLVWHGRPWLIDHGAALYIHHTWREPDEHARRPFERIADHVLLPYAASIRAADERLAPRDRREARHRPGRCPAGRVAPRRADRSATRPRNGRRMSGT